MKKLTLERLGDLRSQKATEWGSDLLFLKSTFFTPRVGGLVVGAWRRGGEDRGPRREREQRKVRRPSFYSDVAVLPGAKAS